MTKEIIKNIIKKLQEAEAIEIVDVVIEKSKIDFAFKNWIYDEVCLKTCEKYLKKEGFSSLIPYVKKQLKIIMDKENRTSLPGQRLIGNPFKRNLKAIEIEVKCEQSERTNNIFALRYTEAFLSGEINDLFFLFDKLIAVLTAYDVSKQDQFEILLEIIKKNAEKIRSDEYFVPTSMEKKVYNFNLKFVKTLFHISMEDYLPIYPPQNKILKGYTTMLWGNLVDMEVFKKACLKADLLLESDNIEAAALEETLKDLNIEEVTYRLIRYLNTKKELLQKQEIQKRIERQTETKSEVPVKEEKNRSDDVSENRSSYYFADTEYRALKKELANLYDIRHNVLRKNLDKEEKYRVIALLMLLNEEDYAITRFISLCDSQEEQPQLKTNPIENYQENHEIFATYLEEEYLLMVDEYYNKLLSMSDEDSKWNALFSEVTIGTSKKLLAFEKGKAEKLLSERERTIYEYHNKA